MRFFIEVCSGEISFKKKLTGEKYINAPNSPRYVKMLSQMQKGDKVLHYLTISLTRKKEWRSAFIGESLVKSSMKIGEKRIICELDDVKFLTNPVKLSSLKTKENITENLKRAINMSMQSYIFEIKENDYFLIKTMSKEGDERSTPPPLRKLKQDMVLLL